ncbi:MAG: hypothetical protein K2G70_02550 [Turicibacter sp.]|nr:hypothetical protein [Turicibacter sp.]
MSGFKQNLYIHSKEDLVGGNYQSVHVSGSTIMRGPLQCETLKVSGFGQFKQKVQVNRMKVSGKSTHDGELIIEDCQISGTLKTKSQIQCLNSLRVSGFLKSTKNIMMSQGKVSGHLKTSGLIKGKELQVTGMCYSDELKVTYASISGIVTVKKLIVDHELDVSGALNVNQLIEAEQLKVSGRLKCTGLINAETIKLEAKSGSTFEEIGASSIKIMKHRSSFISETVISMFGKVAEGLGINQKISGRQIEADEIYVEYATIKKIRGHHVVIGPECMIEEVEYTGSLVVDENSIVKESIRG